MPYEAVPENLTSLSENFFFNFFYVSTLLTLTILLFNLYHSCTTIGLSLSVLTQLKFIATFPTQVFLPRKPHEHIPY